MKVMTTREGLEEFGTALQQKYSCFFEAGNAAPLVQEMIQEVLKTLPSEILDAPAHPRIVNEVLVHRSLQLTMFQCEAALEAMWFDLGNGESNVASVLLQLAKEEIQ